MNLTYLDVLLTHIPHSCDTVMTILTRVEENLSSLHIDAGIAGMLHLIPMDLDICGGIRCAL